MKKFVVYLWVAVTQASVAPLWATENGTGGKTWKTVAEMSAAEKVEVDLRTDTPRDPKVPYLPAEKYPCGSPYTAEEMAYRAMEFPHITDQNVRSKLDYFTSAPSLQRVCCQLQPRRGERFPNTRQSITLPHRSTGSCCARGLSEDKKIFFSAGFMRREWFLEPPKTLMVLNSPEEFYLRPALEKEKLASERMSWFMRCRDCCRRVLSEGHFRSAPAALAECPSSFEDRG